MMNNKILLLILTLFLISSVSASLGTFKQYSCVDLKTVSNSAGVTITSLSYPNSSTIVSNVAMTKDGNAFNYTTCATSELGEYVYGYITADGDEFVNNYFITPVGGLENNTTLFIILVIFALVVLILGFIFHNYIFSFLAGLALLVAGVYTEIYGFGNIANTYTQAIALFLIGLGMIISVISAFDLAEEMSGESSSQYQEEEIDDN